MTDQQPPWSLDGDGQRAVSPNGQSVVMTTVLGRRRRRLDVCRRCVVCASVSWLLLTQLVIDCVQGMYTFSKHLLRSSNLTDRYARKWNRKCELRVH